MKKGSILCVAMILAILVFACGSGPRSSDPNLPDWVLNPPDQEDVLYGIGTAKMATVNQSMTMAESRARQSLAFQINANVQAMITDYAREAGTVNNSVSIQFAEQVGRQVTQTKLSGAVPVKREQAKDGTFWVLVRYPKADAAKAAADIVENEASRYAEFKAMDALKMMDAQLAKNETKPEPVSE